MKKTKIYMAKLIAEIGINHNGSFKESKKLIDLAAEADSWGIKFQFRELKKYFKHAVKRLFLI